MSVVVYAKPYQNYSAYKGQQRGEGTQYVMDSFLYDILLRDVQ